MHSKKTETNLENKYDIISQVTLSSTLIKSLVVIGNRSFTSLKRRCFWLFIWSVFIGLTLHFSEKQCSPLSLSLATNPSFNSRTTIPGCPLVQLSLARNPSNNSKTIAPGCQLVRLALTTDLSFPFRTCALGRPVLAKSRS